MRQRVDAVLARVGELTGEARGPRQRGSGPRPVADSAAVAVEREALKLAVQSPVLVAPVLDGIDEQVWTDERLRAVRVLVGKAGGVSGQPGGEAWVALLRDTADDDELRPALDRHRAARGKSAYRVVPYVAIAPERGDALADTALEVFRENHKSWRGTLSDPDLQVVHRLLGSDSPLQGELLSYLLLDPTFFEAAADLGRRDARRWVANNPDLWRTGPLEDQR